VPTETAVKSVVAPEVEKNALSWPQQATAMVVADQGGYDQATEALKVVKGLASQISETFDPIISAAHAAHKIACDQRKRLLDPLTQAELLIKRKVGSFLDEQERLRLAEQRRLEEEERKRAEEEALATAIANEAALKEAGAAPEEIDAQTALLLDEAPAQVAPVLARPTFQKAAGVSATPRYSAEVTNLKELMKAVLEGKAPENCIIADMTVLNGLARSLKDHLRYPGVKLVKSTGISSRK
jgi:hypothetical protein